MEFGTNLLPEMVIVSRPIVVDVNTVITRLVPSKVST